MKFARKWALIISVMLGLPAMLGATTFSNSAVPQQQMPVGADSRAPAGFGGSTKTVNKTYIKRGDALTYTIVISNSGSLSETVRITDTMPAVVGDSVLYVPSGISGTVYFPGLPGTIYFPGGSGSFGGSVTLPPPWWAWTGTVPANTQLTFLLRVTLQSGITQFTTFSNTVAIKSQTGGAWNIASQDTTFDPTTLVYLPIIMKNAGPPTTPLPNIPCAPTQLVDIPVGSGPRGLAVDEGRTRVYAANRGGSSVSIIDGHSNQVIRTIGGSPAISVPNGIAYDSATDTIWVTNWGSGGTGNIYWVTPINAQTFVVGSPVFVGGEPWAIVFNPVDHNIYVANQADDTVSVINPNTGTVIATIPVGDRPVNMAVHPTTGVVYVANFLSNNVSVLNQTGTLQAPIPLDTHNQPFGIAVDPLNNYVYVTTVESHDIVVIYSVSNTVVGAAKIFRQDGTPVPLRGLALNMTLGTAQGGHLWTTTSSGDYVGPGTNPTQVLFIPKGYNDGFHKPIPNNYSDPVGDGLSTAGIVVNTVISRVYVSLPGTNSVRVLADSETACFDTIRNPDKEMILQPAHTSGRTGPSIKHHSIIK